MKKSLIRVRKAALAATTLLGFATLAATTGSAFEIKGSAGSTVKAEALATFESPWAMTFLSDTQMLVTTKPGKMFLVGTDGKKTEVAGVPRVSAAGQGGLGDVVPHPDFAQNGLVYISYAESTDGDWTRGAVVVRAKLTTGDRPTLSNFERIWEQVPKVSGTGHYGHRIAFGPKGSPQEGKIFITSGDRRQLDAVQDWTRSMGKVIRLNDDGTVPKDNPWQDKGELAKTFWSTGHRNLLGISFDASGRLWTHEMGPRHGDELNLTKPGENYGWPLVSWGNHYSGRKIPDHDTRPEFNAPESYWVPSIAPSGMVIYSGDVFSAWKGNALIGGLASAAIIRVSIDGETAKEVERISWQTRVREVEQGPKGNLWVLEDGGDGRLLKLTPAS